MAAATVAREETFPAAVNASTPIVYVRPQASPSTPYSVDDVVPSGTPSAYTLYPSTGTRSPDAFHATSTLVAVESVWTSPVGGSGDSSEASPSKRAWIAISKSSGVPVP